MQGHTESKNTQNLHERIFTEKKAGRQGLTYSLSLSGVDAAIVRVRTLVHGQVETQQLHEQVGAALPGALAIGD